MSDIYFKFAVNIMYSHTLKFITSTDEAPSLQIERFANKFASCFHRNKLELLVTKQRT